MENNSIVYKNVKLGENVIIEPFCIIGKPSQGKEDGEVETVIGDNARIRSHTVIYAGNRIGDNFQTGHHAVIREDNTIGNDVSIGTLSCVEHDITIEDGVRIHSQAFIPEFSVLKKGAWVGPNVVITNAKYPRGKNVKNLLMGATIEEHAKVGANSTILPGVVIGKGALIGAGSLISKNVPADTVWYGNPAENRGDISKLEEYSKDEK